MLREILIIPFSQEAWELSLKEVFIIAHYSCILHFFHMFKQRDQFLKRIRPNLKINLS